MRMLTRTILAAAACLPLALALPAVAGASQPTEVRFDFSSSGSTVSNTITNNSGTPLTCSTSVAVAPGAVRPPVEQIGDQLRYESGVIQPGTSTQTVVDIPFGSYVALATCGRTDPDPAMWVSRYPGVDSVLALYPYPAYEVDEASPVVILPFGDSATAVTDLIAGLGSVFGS